MELLLNLGIRDFKYAVKMVADIIESVHRAPVYRVSTEVLCTASDRILDEILANIDQVLADLRFPVTVNNFKIRILIRSSLTNADSDSDAQQDDLYKGMMALYQAGLQKKSFVRFEKSNEKMWKERLTILQELASAIAKRNYTIVYQPIYNRSREIVCMEALSRWHDKDGNAVSPGVFIPMLEEAGLMNDFTYIMISLVLDDIRDHDFLRNNGPIFVNISPELINTDFDFAWIVELIDEYRIPHELLGFEITESSVVEDSGSTEKVIQYLRDEGFKIALDDFGTGYSNLTQILVQPFHKIKFDKTFIDSMKDNQKNRQLLEILIRYFNQHNYITLIEGVETQEQFDLLCSYDCREFQGYYLSKPKLSGDLG